MKDRKLRVRVSCTNKDFYLEKPHARADWHIRFTPPRDVREALGIRERVSRTTGTCEIEPAKRIAAGIIESYWNGEALRSLKARDHFDTLGDLVRLYRAGARTIEDKDDLDAQTITKNVSSLIRIVETRFDEDGRERRAAGSWERMPLDRALAAEVWNEFKRGWLRAHRDNPSAKRTANSYMRQARSLFADEYLPLYSDLKLPDLAQFRGDVKMFKKPGKTRYVPIAQPIIDGMESEICGLRQLRPDLYLGFFFMLWLGMRLEEVCEARLEWLETWPEQTRMVIIRRGYYSPKGIDGDVPVAPRLVADIRELSGARENLEYLIPADNPTARRNALGRELSAIIRRHIGDERQKTCHELRKHAVSMQLMRTRSWVDTLKFSRHADLRTLQEHYAGFLDTLPAISSSNWRAA
jgi:integrase